jgi:hypothetical protein
VAGQSVLAAGPWTDELLAGAVRRGVASREMPRHALGLNLEVGRRQADAAIGLRSERSAAEDPFGGAAGSSF